MIWYQAKKLNEYYTILELFLLPSTSITTFVENPKLTCMEMSSLRSPTQNSKREKQQLKR